MIFGIREKTTVLGRFTSDRCEACKKEREYRMEKTVRYLVVFGVNVVPLRVRYAGVCEGCGVSEPVKNRTARELAGKHFKAAQRKQQFCMALRLLAAAAVIAAAVVLPLTIRAPLSRDTETIKALVSADGTYAIKSADDELLAIVHAEGGTKTIIWYDEVSVLANTGSQGGKFYMHETYEEAADASGKTILIRNIDDPGRLLDQYDSIIRQYSYNEDTGELSFYQGVEDLSAIEYTPGKVTYPYTYFNEEGEKQQYVSVLYLLSNARMSVQFAEASDGSFSKPVAVFIDSMSGSRVTDQRCYYLSDEQIALAQQAGLTPDNSAQDFSDFLQSNGVEPTLTYHYEFYGSTGVIASETHTVPDENGDMQTSAVTYTITAKDGYYIIQ